MKVLFECEHIITVDALIVDGVHQLLHQQDAQATDGTVFGIERGVDLVGLRRVKGFTLVGDDDFEPLLGGFGFNGYVSLCTNGIGIAHHVDHGLLDSQHEL